MDPIQPILPRRPDVSPVEGSGHRPIRREDEREEQPRERQRRRRRTPQPPPDDGHTVDVRA